MVSKQVALEFCANYQDISTDNRIEQILSSIGFEIPSRGDIVLLKPNLVSASAPVHGLTNAQFIRSVAEFFLDHGCKIMLGDSPAFGSTRSVCRKVGIESALKDLPLEFVNFTKVEKVKLACGVEVKLSSLALNCDLLVNMPKLKAHSQLGYSFAVKNCFGIICGLQKGLLHMQHGKDRSLFNRIILDIQKYLPHQLVLADGIDVMHKSGPIKGKPLNLSCLGAANDSLLFDYYMTKLLGIKFDQLANRHTDIDGSLMDGDHQWLRDADFQIPDNLDCIRFDLGKFAKSVVKRIVKK